MHPDVYQKLVQLLGVLGTHSESLTPDVVQAISDLGDSIKQFPPPTSVGRTSIVNIVFDEDTIEAVHNEASVIDHTSNSTMDFVLRTIGPHYNRFIRSHNTSHSDVVFITAVVRGIRDILIDLPLRTMTDDRSEAFREYIRTVVRLGQGTSEDVQRVIEFFDGQLDMHDLILMWHNLCARTLLSEMVKEFITKKLPPKYVDFINVIAVGILQQAFSEIGYVPEGEIHAP
jgi:hypothetical protein